MIRAGVRASLAAILHVLPLKSGLGGVSNARLARWSCGRGGAVRARLRNGLRLVVDPADYNGRMLLLFGTPDPKVVATCRALLRPGDVFLDIGANHGAVGLLCAASVGSAGEVHLFEPQNGLCDRMRQCIRDSGLTTCRVHEVALLSRGGLASLAGMAGHSGAWRVVRQPAGERAADVVTVRAADCAIYEAVQKRAFGAKLDVEGAEHEVLPALVAQEGFRFVVFECNTADAREWAWEFATERELRYLGLGRSAWSTTLRAVDSGAALAQFHDLLAVRRRCPLPRGWTGGPGALRRALDADCGI
jgi:FkbM family methyltransferase